MSAQEGSTRLLIVAAAAAAGWYMFGPQIQAALPDLTRELGKYIGPTMRLDPSAKDPIEDRRSGIGGGLGRLGPQQGRQGGMPPWEQAGGGDFPDDGGGFPGAGGGFPGGGFPGPETGGMPSGRRPMGCMDTRTGRPVPIEFCDREHRRRR